MKKLVSILFGALLLVIVVSAQELSDAQIINVLKTANEGEVALAHFALPRLSSQEAISFAEQMIKDHEQRFVNVTKTAGELGIAPKESEITAKARNSTLEAMQTIATLKGDDADNFYLQHQLQAHQQDEKLLEQLQAQDPQVQQLVDDLNKIVMEHLQMLQK